MVLVNAIAETTLRMEFIQVEEIDFIGNTFGENISSEPPRMKQDNWIRGKVKVVKSKKVDSVSSISRQMKMLENSRVNSSFNRYRRRNSSNSVSVRRERERRVVVPEPVEI